MNKYINEFLSFKCLPDITAAVFPINKAEKEITERMRK